MLASVCHCERSQTDHDITFLVEIDLTWYYTIITYLGSFRQSYVSTSQSQTILLRSREACQLVRDVFGLKLRTQAHFNRMLIIYLTYPEPAPVPTGVDSKPEQRRPVNVERHGCDGLVGQGVGHVQLGVHEATVLS